MLTVAFQVKVSADMAVKLNERLREVSALHERDLIALERKLKAGHDVAKLASEKKILDERGRRLTVQHFLRVMIATGLLHSGSAPDLLAAMAKDRVVGGRPAKNAKHEGKRGGAQRAA